MDKCGHEQRSAALLLAFAFICLYLRVLLSVTNPFEGQVSFTLPCSVPRLGGGGVRFYLQVPCFLWMSWPSRFFDKLRRQQNQFEFDFLRVSVWGFCRTPLILECHIPFVQTYAMQSSCTFTCTHPLSLPEGCLDAHGQFVEHVFCSGMRRLTLPRCCMNNKPWIIALMVRERSATGVRACQPRHQVFAFLHEWLTEGQRPRHWQQAH